MNNPTRVREPYLHISDPPLVLSDRCQWWQQRIRDGWRPSRRIRAMGWSEAARYYGVYCWEYIYLLQPMFEGER